MDRRKAIFVGKAATILAVIPVLIYAYATGPDPRNTGAPGDTTCSQSGCHLGTVNPPGASVSIAFAGDLTYTPGVKQTLTVTVAPVGASKDYGFQASVRSAGKDSYKTTQAGTFSFTDKNLQVLCEDGTLRGNSGCKASAQLEFIEHGGGGSSASSKNSWTFDWTPPATDVGDIKIYVAGNAGNGDGKADNKDMISTNVYTLKVAAATSNKPAISAGGVITAGDFGAAPAMGPGSWIEIYGANLATSTRSWAGDDFVGTTAPSTLDGVRVMIANVPAFLGYISPDHINAQVPSSVGPGTQDITVTNANGTSAAYSAKVNVTQPGLLAPGAFKIGGKQYVVAQFANNSYVLPPGAIGGLGTRQAKPGETVLIYGVGFGATSPNVVAGQIAAGLNPLATPVTVTIGGSPATVSYGGLAPGFVGLYQFNIVVPNIDNNDQAPIVFSHGGTPVSQSLVTAVKK
jgi:uncharacterized protein (TIGR03437 family)